MGKINRAMFGLLFIICGLAFSAVLYAIIPPHIPNCEFRLENLPIFGGMAGVVEAPISTVMNLWENQAWLNLSLIPKSLGMGVLNGAERFFGTMFFGWEGKYNRRLGVNGAWANNRFASNIVGWIALLFLIWLVYDIIKYGIYKK